MHLNSRVTAAEKKIIKKLYYALENPFIPFNHLGSLKYHLKWEAVELLEIYQPGAFK